MINELANLIDDFLGPANQTQCFTYVLNLVVKSIIQQFDLPNLKSNKILDEVSKELLSLAGNIKFEEEELEWRGGEDGVGGENDNVEGWIDECSFMTKVELDELDKSVEPVCVLLTKVSWLDNRLI